MVVYKRSRIRETKNILTNADSRVDRILKRLHDFFFIRCCVVFLSKKKWRGVRGGGDQLEAGIPSCDLRANERPQKKFHEKGTGYIYMRQCEIKDIKLYQAKTKVIALG